MWALRHSQHIRDPRKGGDVREEGIRSRQEMDETRTELRSRYPQTKVS